MLKGWAIVRSQLHGLVLDIGCGDGQVTYTYPNVIGLDTQIQKCRIPLILGDMHNLPFKSGVLDTVVFNHSLEHTAHPELALPEVYRVLKFNGKVVVNVPNARCFLWPLYWLRRGYIYGKDHKSFFTFTSLKSLLGEIGFTVTETPTTPFTLSEESALFFRLFLGVPLVKRLVTKTADWLSNLYPIFSYEVMCIAYKEPRQEW